MGPTLARDTSPEIDLLQVEGWRHMSSAQKAATVTALTNLAIDMTKAGIRHRHPGASDAWRRRRLAVILLGPELAARAYPGAIDATDGAAGSLR